MSDNLIEINDLTFGYEDKLVLHHLNFTIKKGEFVGIIGDNGSGKSTFLKLITGLIKTKKGIINKAPSLKISYVDQITLSNDISFPATVMEILTLGIPNNFWGFLTFRKEEKINKVVEEIGIKDLLDKRMQDLSGGQQQKVRLASSLLSNPDLLILDEPTTGIDKKSVSDFLTTIKNLFQSGTSIIMISHRIEDLKDATIIYTLNDEHLEVKNV